MYVHNLYKEVIKAAGPKLPFSPAEFITFEYNSVVRRIHPNHIVM